LRSAVSRRSAYRSSGSAGSANPAVAHSSAAYASSFPCGRAGRNRAEGGGARPGRGRTARAAGRGAVVGLRRDRHDATTARAHEDASGPGGGLFGLPVSMVGGVALPQSRGPERPRRRHVRHTAPQSASASARCRRSSPGRAGTARSDLEADGLPPVVRSHQPLDRVGTAS
jgi:hypothetical protein